MLNYIEYLKIPATISVIVVALLLIMQLVGELLEFKGKTVPEIIKLRKYFNRKKKERQALSQMTDLLDKYSQMNQTLDKVNRLLAEIDKHYSEDNITLRNDWMKEVNEHIVDIERKREEQNALMIEFSKKLDKNNADTLSLLIDNKRSTIIDFASYVVEGNNSVTKEQFNRIFKLYEEYEDIIAKNGLTNGEVAIAYRIITESYENHMRNHTFIEDIRGY